MEKRFFCAACGQMGHIMQVTRTVDGVVFREHKLGKDISCEAFVLCEDDFANLDALFTPVATKKNTVTNAVNTPTTKSTDKKTQSNKVTI